ncbi:MAG: hypothetical protein JNK47_00105 [Mesorhizobium sp.]|nr:DUF5681 domain-containing protein [Mesorhizobium sp.]MBL8575600.1 hypothetical protein [Mesorhizobium sp.]
MTNFNDDDDDHNDVRTNRVARKVRTVEYQRKPASVAKSEPEPEQAQATTPAPATAPAPVLPRRRPPPAPAPQLHLQGGGGSAEASVEAETPEDETDDGKVGYGRAPRHSRFRKGRSGNPRGRPKNSRSLKTFLLKVLDEVVEVNEHGRKRKMTKREVIARQTVQQAMKGNLKSLAVITAFDPVEDELPKENEPLRDHEAEMLAHLLGLVPEKGDGK